MPLNSGISLSGAFASLARINTRYLIEWHRSGVLYQSMALPLPPSALTIEQSAPKQIIYTLGDDPIREIGRYKNRSIELSGSAGYDARPSLTADGKVISAFGPDILIAFRKFLEDYQRTASEEGPDTVTKKKTTSKEGPDTVTEKKRLNQHQLIFRALDEDIHLKVEVDALTIQRSADGDNLAPAWTLQLSAYDSADEPPKDANLFDIEGALSGVTNAIQSAANVTAAIQLQMEGTNAYLRRSLQPLLLSLDQVTNAARGTVDAIAEIADIPNDIIRQMSKTAGRIRSLITSVIDEVVTFDDELNAEWNLLLTTLGLAEEVQIQADSTATTAPYLLSDLARAIDPPLLPNVQQTQSAPRPPREQVTTYRLRLGEDLRVLAFRLFRAPERYVELQLLNGWLSERHNQRGLPAREGDLILLPAIDTQPTNPTRNQRSPYGQDLMIDPKTGDLEMKGRDFTLIRGARNIEQAARHRLTTTQSETPILDGYGLPQRIGERVTIESAGYLSAHIREQLTRDPRLESVNVVELQDKGDHLSASVEFRAIAGAIFSERIAI
tara:strand:+ start:5309 stop:6970 length:1662 start_codon:yes stop_codon:yes gene_type:complete